MAQDPRVRLRAVTAIVLVVAVAGLPSVSGAHADLETVLGAVADEVAKHPDDPTMRLHQAQGLRMAGEWDAALAALDRASLLGADPDLVVAERGLVLLEAGRAAAAVAEFDLVLARRPDRPAVRLARGRAWRKLGRPAWAARDLGHAVMRLPRVTPEDVIEWRDALLAAGRPAEALAALDRGMRRLGPLVSLQVAGVDLAERLGRDDEALRRLTELVREVPRNETWLLREGRLLERLGRGEEAQRAFTAALAIVESRPLARRTAASGTVERELRAALAASPDRGGSIKEGTL